MNYTLHNFEVMLKQELHDLYGDQPELQNDGPRFLVACSGGPDSVALTLALHKICKNISMELGMFHFNFALRGRESELDELFCAQLAEQLGIPFFCRRNNLPPPTTGIQEWARELRYQEFEALSRDGWIICLGHQLNDVGENALLRMARGAAVGQWAGMRKWQAPYWRPLLMQSKDVILRYLADMQQDYRTDSSNEQQYYSRNLIRHSVLPVLERLYPNAVHRIANATLDAQDIQEWVYQNLHNKWQMHKPDLLGLLAGLPRGTALLAIKVALDDLLGHELATETIERPLLEDIYQALCQKSQQSTNELKYSLNLHWQLIIRRTARFAHLDLQAAAGKKSARQEQFDRQLNYLPQQLFISANSYVFFNGCSRLWIANRTLPEGATTKDNIGENLISRSCQLSAEPYSADIKLGATIRESGLQRESSIPAKSWRIRDLLRMWRVGAQERRALLLLRVDNQPVALYNRKSFWVPDQDGQRVETNKVETCYFSIVAED